MTPAVTVGGPSSYAGLSSSTACYWNGFDAKQFFAPYAGKIVARPGTFGPYLSAANDYTAPPGYFTDGLAYCADSLQSGESDVWLDDSTTLHLQHLDVAQQLPRHHSSNWRQ